MTRLSCAALLGVFIVTACGGGAPSSQAQADASTRAACRTRADQVYDQQNRGAIYSPASQVNTPFSNNYLPDQADRGLSDLFSHDKLVSDCVRNTGTGAQLGPTAAKP